MTEIRFYHLQKQTLDQALPLILEKAYASGKKILVRMESESEVERMNTHLWTHNPNSFLPHGSAKNDNPEKQPIYLTHQNDNENQAEILMLTQNRTEEKVETYSLCCEMLDGRDIQAIEEARIRWKAYSNAGHDVTYWFQSETGKWEKKA